MALITGPGELVALVPSLLGFDPSGSVVVVLVRDHGRLASLMRLDGADLLGDDATQIATAMARHAAQESARQAVVLAFMDDAVAGGIAADEAVAALEDTVGCVEAWQVIDDRYFCPDCVDPTCCPPGGRAVPEARGERGPAWRSVAVAGATRAGPDVRRLCTRAAARWERRAERTPGSWRHDSLRLWLTALDEGADGPAPLGRLAAALADVKVRDAVLLALIPGAQQAVTDAMEGVDSQAIGAALGAGMRPARAPDPDRADALDVLLDRLLAVAPPRLCAPPAGVRGVLEWWRGDPAAARAWSEIALEHDPGYRLSLLTLALIETAEHPG